jgi:hypothetical protein
MWKACSPRVISLIDSLSRTPAGVWVKEAVRQRPQAYASHHTLGAARASPHRQPLELCTLHLQDSADLEVILGALLFGDGSAASLVAAEPNGIVQPWHAWRLRAASTLFGRDGSSETQGARQRK